MIGAIGKDVLDIGSRKAAMTRAASQMADPMGLGRPGQFELPNVVDVRNNDAPPLCDTMENLNDFCLLNLLLTISFTF